jgi:hypothetical protein
MLCSASNFVNCRSLGHGGWQQAGGVPGARCPGKRDARGEMGYAMECIRAHEENSYACSFLEPEVCLETNSGRKKITS